MVEASSDRFTLQSMKKKPEENYKEYPIRWKAMVVQVRPPLTQREINSYFVDTLPFLYYDMLVGNAFFEFGDLLIVVERIEDGVRQGRIVNAEARMPDKKRNVIDEYVQATLDERKNKRKFNEEEVIKSLSHSSQQIMFSPPQLSV